MTSNILMIGGTGRSGTTILSKIFARHPEIANVPEWRFLIDPDGIIDFYKNVPHWSPYHYDLKLKRLLKLLRSLENMSYEGRGLNKMSDVLSRRGLVNHKLSSRYSNISTKKHCPNFGSLVNSLEKSLTSFQYEGWWCGMPFGEKNSLHYRQFDELTTLKDTRDILASFIEGVISCVLETQGCTHYLEKNTWNILWLDSILELVPSTKLVHIYRDPRDVVSSYMQQSWMPNNAAQSALILRDLINRWEATKQRTDEGVYHEVSLEALTSNTVETLSDICSFWDIPWSDDLLTVDLSRSHSDRWKTDLSRSDQRIVDSILGPTLEHLGYE